MTNFEAICASKETLKKLILDSDWGDCGSCVYYNPLPNTDCVGDCIKGMKLWVDQHHEELTQNFERVLEIVAENHTDEICEYCAFFDTADCADYNGHSDNACQNGIRLWLKHEQEGKKHGF